MVANRRRLLDRLGDPFPCAWIIFLGASDERELCDSMSEAWAGLPKSAPARFTEPKRSMVGMSALLVGHGGGPMHLAPSVDAPSLSIFAVLGGCITYLLKLIGKHYTSGSFALADLVHRLLRPPSRWIFHTPGAEYPSGVRISRGDLAHEMTFNTSSNAQPFL